MDSPEILREVVWLVCSSLFSPEAQRRKVKEASSARKGLCAMPWQNQTAQLQLAKIERRLVFTCDVQFLSIFPSVLPLFFASVEEKHMHGLFGRPLLQVGNQVH